MPGKTLTLLFIIRFTGVQPNPNAEPNPQQGLDLMYQETPQMFIINRRFVGMNTGFPMMNRRLPIANQYITIDESDKGRNRIC